MRRTGLIRRAISICLIALMTLITMQAEAISCWRVYAYDNYNENSSDDLVSVYVISSQYVKNNKSKKKYLDRKFSYYDNGLLKSIQDSGLFTEFGFPFDTYYSYHDNSKLAGALVIDGFGTYVGGICICNYDKTGNLTGFNWLYDEGLENTAFCIESKYSYNGGKISRDRAWTYYSENDDGILDADLDELLDVGIDDMEHFYSYAKEWLESGTMKERHKVWDMKLSYNKAGLVKKEMGKMLGKKITITRKYDKKNNCSSMRSNRSDFNYKKVTNKYNKNGLLTKTTFKQGNYTDTYYYKYKKIEVPKEVAAEVYAQRWALQNNNTNYKLVFYEEY